MFSISEIEAYDLASKIQDDPSAYEIIDVREPMEWQAGTIPGAKLIPMRTIPAHMDKLNAEKPIVLMCRSGARSAHAVAYMNNQGFKNVHNLRGGLISWAGNGLPIEAPSQAA